MFTRLGILGFLIVFGMSLLASERPEWVGLGGYTGFEGIGISEGFGTAGLYVFPWNDELVQPYLNPQVHLIETGQWAANVGLGVRQRFTRSLVLGANGYYDYREGCFSGYHRLGFGLEAFRPLWSACFNRYIPLPNRHQAGPVNTYSFPGGYLATCRETECNLDGYDGEITRLFHGIFRAGIGTYYYTNGCCDQYWGLMLRGEFYVNRVLRFRGRFYYDEVNFGRGQLEVTFILSSLRPTRSALRRFVCRNQMLSLDRGCCWTSNF